MGRIGGMGLIAKVFSDVRRKGKVSNPPPAKAPSPLRSAGALYKQTASSAHCCFRFLLVFVPQPTSMNIVLTKGT
jgi:hypothetical protein